MKRVLSVLLTLALAMSLTAKPDDNKRKIMPVGHINVG